ESASGALVFIDLAYEREREAPLCPTPGSSSSAGTHRDARVCGQTQTQPSLRSTQGQGNPRCGERLKRHGRRKQRSFMPTRAHPSEAVLRAAEAIQEVGRGSDGGSRPFRG